MGEEDKKPHEILASKKPHNPLAGRVDLPKDPLAQAAVDALTVLNGLRAGDQINMGEIISQVIILLNFLLQQNKRRKEEYTLILEAINDINDLMSERSKIKGKDYGFQESKFKQKISRWLRGDGN